MQRKFLEISEKIVSVIFAILVIYMFLASIVSTCVMVYTDEHTYYIKDFPILMCVGLVCFVIVLMFLVKKIVITEKTWRRITVAVTIIWFALLIAIVAGTSLHMVHDQYKVYHGANDFLNGNFTNWKPHNYFYAYPYINGMVLMEIPFIWLFGVDKAYLAMQYINILFWYGTILLLTKMAEKYFGKKVERFTYFTLLAFLPMWLYVTFVYGTIPAMFFGVLSFYLEQKYEENGKWKVLICSLLSMILSVAWKSNFQIFLIALLLMLFVHGIRTKQKWSFIGSIAALILLCFELTWISMFVHFITGESVEGNTPTITWVAMGLQDSSIAPGWYNAYTENMYKGYNYDQEAITQASIENIKYNIDLFCREPMYALRFFFRKTASMWNNPSFQSLTIVTKRNIYGTLSYFWKDLLYDGGTKNVVLRIVMDIMHSMTLFGMVLHVILNRKRQDLKHCILKVTFIGGFLFHLVWEAMGQYALPYYILIIPFAVHGYELLVRRLQTLFANTNTVKEKATAIKNASLNTGSGKRMLALAVVILLIAVADFEILNSSIKLQGEESDYIWYCTNEIQWKNDDYYKT